MANETLNIQNGVSPITIDTEVTEGSMRPVTSDGIYKAIQAGGGGGGLPSVTIADYGKMPIVDDQGHWSVKALNENPRYLSLSLSSSDGKTFTAVNQFYSESIVEAITGGFEVRVNALWNDNFLFEVTLPPLQLVRLWTMSSYAAVTQGHIPGNMFQIIVSGVDPDTPQSAVAIEVLFYESAMPEKKISLVITDPITYSGTADITQSDIVNYKMLGASFSFEVNMGQSVITFKATEIISNSGTYSVGGVVYIAGIGLAYIETSGSTFTTTPLVAVSP